MALDYSDSIRLSQLEEAEVQAILLQLDERELRMLAREHLLGELRNPRDICLRLAMDMNFTLTTKIQLTFNQF